MKAFVRGGLGNQLFQICFLHHQLFNDLDKITVFGVDQGRLDRGYGLRPFIRNCEHFLSEDIEMVVSGNVTWRNSIWVQDIPEGLFSPITARTYSPPSTLDFDGILGYFENFRYVEDSWTVFGPELVRTLEEVKTEEVVEEEYVAVHLRRGDSITWRGDSLLGAEYYASAINHENISNANLPIIAFTDDIAGTRDLARELGIEKVYGPENLSAWQTLKAISSARHVIAANSTLSWWGAFVSSKSGGTAFLPRPWLYQQSVEESDSFEFPGSNVLPAYFTK